MSRYVLHPGPVISQHDRERHYIGAKELAALYGVNLSECVMRPDAFSTAAGRVWVDMPFDIHLRPRADGDYRLPRYAMIHRQGCGGPAFLMVRRPEWSDRLDANDIRHLDGSRALASDPVRCESCGQNLMPHDLRPDAVEPLGLAQ